MEELRKQLIEETKKKIVGSFDRQTLIVQTSRFISDLDSAILSLKSRMKGWYAYFDHKVKDVLDVSGKKSSLGVDLDAKDMEVLNGNVAMLKSMVRLREENYAYLNKLMKEKVPRFTEVAGVEIGAKLIDAANGIKQLASMATSKVQLLGAEKALFRHLREGGKPPKYGIIYFHESVQNAENKGKAARKLASEISKAVRVDYFRK